MALLYALWGLLVWSHALAAPPARSAEDVNLIVNQAVFKDKTGQMTLSDVVDAPFEPVRDMFVGGYTSDAVWLRLVLRPAHEGEPVVLRVLPAYLNAVTLFTPGSLPADQWRSQTTGNAVPWQARPYPAVGLGFVVQPQEQTTYFLRLNTVSNAMLQIQAYPLAQAVQEELQGMLWQGLYGAVILWVVLWGVQDYLLRRDPISLTFAVAYGVYFVYVMTVQGYLAVILPTAQGLDTANHWVVTLAVMTALVFHRAFLGLFALPRRARWTLNTLLACGMGNLALLALGQTAWALKLNSVLALLSAPTLWAVALTATGSALPGTHQLRIYYGLLALSVTLYVLPVLGLDHGGTWALHGALIQGLVSAVLFAHLLQTRSQRLMRQQAGTELSLALAHQEVSQHRAQMAEQSRFTAMLTHELKNPLATIRLSLDSMDVAHDPQAVRRQQRIDRALSDIDALVERCAMTDRIEQRQCNQQTTEIDVPKLVAHVLASLPDAGRVQVEFGRDAPTVLRTDAQLLSVALVNLSDNALKHSPPGSPVLLQLQAKPLDSQPAGPGIRVTVRNAPGPAGLPDAQQVFDKYYRGPGTSRLSGFGLGLYLVRAIAHQLGGQVNCAPLHDPPAIEFSLCLPLTPR